MKTEDYFKPLYLCGVYVPPSTGYEGRSSMALTCVSNGDTKDEIICNYIHNIKNLYPFIKADFIKRFDGTITTVDGLPIRIFRLHEEGEGYKIGEELKMSYDEQMVRSGWIDASARKPEDRDYVLIIHPDFKTPIKAWYRDDGPGASWIFVASADKRSVYEWETMPNAELLIRWWRPLPFIPEAYFEHLKELKEKLK